MVIYKGQLLFVTGHPFDTLKVRLQTQPSPPIYKNAVDCFRQLVKSDGVSDFDEIPVSW
jgi:hypothetical protein